MSEQASIANIDIQPDDPEWLVLKKFCETFDSKRMKEKYACSKTHKILDDNASRRNGFISWNFVCFFTVSNEAQQRIAPELKRWSPWLYSILENVLNDPSYQNDLNNYYNSFIDIRNKSYTLDMAISIIEGKLNKHSLDYEMPPLSRICNIETKYLFKDGTQLDFSDYIFLCELGFSGNKNNPYRAIEEKKESNIFKAATKHTKNFSLKRNYCYGGIYFGVCGFEKINLNGLHTTNLHFICNEANYITLANIKCHWFKHETDNTNSIDKLEKTDIPFLFIHNISNKFEHIDISNRRIRLSIDSNTEVRTLNFLNVVIENDVQFANLELEHATFSSVIFESDFSFLQNTVEKTTYFRHCSFKESSNFKGSKFSCNELNEKSLSNRDELLSPSFINSNFQSVLNLKDTNFHAPPHFEGVEADCVLFDEKSSFINHPSKDPELAASAWASLVRLAEHTGNMRMRQLFHARMMENEKRMASEKSHGFFYHVFRILGSGRNTLVPIAFLLLSFICFGLIYMTSYLAITPEKIAPLYANAFDNGFALSMQHTAPFFPTEKALLKNLLLPFKESPINYFINLARFVQTILSIGCIFMFGLSLRNRFRIKT